MLLSSPLLSSGCEDYKRADDHLLWYSHAATDVDQWPPNGTSSCPKRKIEMKLRGKWFSVRPRTDKVVLEEKGCWISSFMIFLTHWGRPHLTGEWPHRIVECKNRVPQWIVFSSRQTDVRVGAGRTWLNVLLMDTFGRTGLGLVYTTLSMYVYVTVLDRVLFNK